MVLRRGFFSYMTQEKSGRSAGTKQEVVPTKPKISRRLPEIWKDIYHHAPKFHFRCIYRASIASVKCLFQLWQPLKPMRKQTELRRRPLNCCITKRQTTIFKNNEAYSNTLHWLNIAFSSEKFMSRIKMNKYFQILLISNLDHPLKTSILCMLWCASYINTAICV